MPGPPAANWAAITGAACTGAVTVTVDKIRLTIPPMPVTRLIGILATGQLSDLIPGCLPGDQKTAWIRHLFDPYSRFDLPDADAVTRAVTEYLTGIPPETAVSLAAWLTADWLFLDGYHLARGVDLLALAPPRLMAALYAFRVEHTSAKRDEEDAGLFPAREPSPEETGRDEAAMASLLNAGPISG